MTSWVPPSRELVEEAARRQAHECFPAIPISIFSQSSLYLPFLLTYLSCVRSTILWRWQALVKALRLLYSVVRTIVEKGVGATGLVTVTYSSIVRLCREHSWKDTYRISLLTASHGNSALLGIWIKRRPSPSAISIYSLDAQHSNLEKSKISIHAKH